MQEMRGGRKSELKTSRAEQTGLYSPGRQTLPKRASSDTIGPQPSKTAQKATAGRNGVHSTTKSNTYRTKAGPHGTIRVHGTRTKQTKSTRRSPANPAIRHQRQTQYTSPAERHRGEVRRHDGGGQTDSLLLISTHIRIIRTSPRRRKIPRSRCPDLNQPIPIRKTADRHGPLAQKEDWVSGWWRRPSADLRPRRLRTV